MCLFHSSGHYNVKAGDSIWQHSPAARWKHDSSPSLSPKKSQRRECVCVFVCMCVEEGWWRKTNKDTRSGHTPVSGCTPSASPQTTTYAFCTHTHTHTHIHARLRPISSCGRSTLICPQSPNHLLYCKTRSPEITSQSKIIRYYCPAAPWHCAINKAIVEGRSLFGHRIIDSLTDLLCALSLFPFPFSLPREYSGHIPCCCSSTDGLFVCSVILGLMVNT